MKREKDSQHAETAGPSPVGNRLKERTTIPPSVLRGNSLWKGRIFTAAELMAQEFPAVRWAVPKVIPQGVTILASKPKTGKSWLVLGAGVAISTGGVALGKVPVEQGDCLYLALEDNRRRLQNRLSKLLVGAEPPKQLHIANEWPRLDEGGVEELGDWLAIHPDARAVFIDTLKKIRPRTSTYNKGIYDLDYEALEPLVPLAADHNVAIVVVHHTRKLAAADPLDEISGSTGLSGGADGVLVLKRDRGRADAYLHVTGREIEVEAELALRWDPDTAGWTLVGDADEYRLNEERADVLRVLEEAQDAMGPREVADALGADYNATRQRLYQMGRSGEAQVIGRGRYTIPNKPNNPNKRLSQANPDVRDTQASPNNREGRKGPLDGGSDQDVREVRDVRSDYERLVEERTVGREACIHEVVGGCHLCNRDKGGARKASNERRLKIKKGVGALSRQCAGITREGRRCTVSVSGAHGGAEFCHLHDPGRSEERRRSARRAGKARPSSREIRDLKDEIRDVIADVKAGELDRNDAAVMIQGYRALKDFIALERQVRELEDLEPRLEALAGVLKLRSAR